MAIKEYNYKKIQDKYKAYWFDNKLYKAVDFDKRPKKYILAELPYPSGPFLHIGHMMRYTVPEVKARYYRMKGFNVLFPMGWDCFGLPAETFAIKINATPQEALSSVIPDYKDSLKTMGYSIDWDREVNTSDPSMYKWTQWMFLEIYKQGLIEKIEMPMWWCEELGVLADEEVLNDDDSPTGKVSERGGYVVERRMQKQWVLKIKKYADKLISDLDKTDYEENVKKGQINWIGKSTGASITFSIAGKNIDVFTTRPDTLHGVTFMAISPEHDLLDSISSQITNLSEVKDYINLAKNLSDLEKQTKSKTGIKVEGVEVVHPITGQAIPLYIADYILKDYGTGVVMGVPGHDKRDLDFAQKYNIEIKVVVKDPVNSIENSVGYLGEGEIVNSGENSGKYSSDFRNEIIENLEKNNLGKKTVTYKIRHQIFGRQRYWGEPIPIYYDQNGDLHLLELRDLPLELPMMKNFLPDEQGISPLERNEEWNTFEKDGEQFKRETDTMPTWAGSNWYYIRYLDPQNTKTFCEVDKMNYWLPVDEYYGDPGHTTAHLIYTRFWIKALHDVGHIPISEPIKWRMSGGLLLGEDRRKMSKSRLEYMVNAEELISKFGSDSVRMALCFLGPYNETYPYNPQSVKACYKVIDTIWNTQYKVDEKIEDEQVNIAMEKLISNLDNMYESLKMNTAVSEIMKFMNVVKTKDNINSNVWENLLLCIAPITPFLAEELWQIHNGYEKWNNENSIHVQPFPTSTEIKVESLELPVQVNGKLRGTINISPEDSEETILDKALKISTINKHLNGKPKKVIYVENKILNLIV